MLCSASCSRLALKGPTWTTLTSSSGRAGANDIRSGSERCMATRAAAHANPSSQRRGRWKERTTHDIQQPLSRRSLFPLQTQSQIFAVTPDSSFHAPRNASAAARLKMQLAACAEDGDATQALNICAEMKKSQIAPDVATYNWLIQACAKQGLATECLAFLEDMEAVGLKPTLETYNHVIYGQRLSQTSRLEDLLYQMEKAGLQPNTHTYHHIIQRHAEARNLEMCLQCFAEMSQLNISPGLRSAQAVIRLATALGHARLAFDLAHAFEATSVRKLEAQDWVQILSACTSCYFKDGVVEAWQKVVVEHSITPDEGQCIEVLHTAGRHGLTDLALNALQAIHGTGVPLQEYHLIPILEAFCKQQMIEHAFSIVNLMRSNGILVTQDTTLPILACIRDDIDEVDKAWGILENMHKNGKQIDIASLNVLIQASVGFRDLQRAVGTYKAFPDLGVKPNIETFNHLLSGCITASHRDLGDRMLTELKEQGLVPNADTFERVILLCLTQPTYEDAFFYLEEMKGQGHLPPLSVYEALVKKCVVNEDVRWKLALEELQECGHKVTPFLQQFVDSGGKVADRGRWVDHDSGDEPEEAQSEEGTTER